jgi:hypothetical protein
VEPETGRRWPLAFEGAEPEAVDGGEYAVATVVVPEQDPAAALEIDFTGSWEPVVSGADRQVLGTRMLAGKGAVVFPSVALSVEMVLHIPTERESEHRLVGRTGADRAVATVSSECVPGPVRLEGRGTHQVRLSLGPPDGGSACAVRIEPEFVLVDPTSFHRMAVQLRRLTWSPAETSTASS